MSKSQEILQKLSADDLVPGTVVPGTINVIMQSSVPPRADPEKAARRFHVVAPSTTPLNDLAVAVRGENEKWYRDPKTGRRIRRNKGEMIALMHSELSECLEGERKDLMDDHLPRRRMAEVELADTLIRIFDYAGEFGYDLDGAVAEKRAYNAKRADHKREARMRAGGKKF